MFKGARRDNNVSSACLVSLKRVFEEKSDNLSNFSDRIVRTAKMVAVGTGTGNKKVAEALLATAGQVRLNLYQCDRIWRFLTIWATF